MARAACSSVVTALASLPSKSLLCKNQFLFTGKSKFVGVLTLEKRCFSSKVSMSLKAGIVGLPNVGKSTLFNAVVENGKAQAANFPFCTIEPNVGIVAVPDSRHGISDANVTDDEGLAI